MRRRKEVEEVCELMANFRLLVMGVAQSEEHDLHSGVRAPAASHGRVLGCKPSPLPIPDPANQSLLPRRLPGDLGVHEWVRSAHSESVVSDVAHKLPTRV